MIDLTATVDISEEGKDCFFTLDCGVNWCPGWVIGKITLPVAIYSNIYYLVWDATGCPHWVSASKVKYRGDCHKFEFAYYKTFDWEKWRNFPKITDPIIPTSGNSEDSNKPILKAFRTGENSYF